MPYESQRQPDGTVLIKDVLVMAPATKAQRPDWGRDIGPDWLRAAAANFQTLASLKNYPPVYDGHTAERDPATKKMRRKNVPVIGRLLSLRMDHDARALRGDIWLTEKTAIATWESGGFPSLSPEFWPNLEMLKGVAFLRGEEPHFEAFPDLSPREFFERMPVALASHCEGEALLAAGSRVDTEVSMELTKENIEAIVKAVAPAVAEALKPALEAHASKAEPTSDVDVLAEIEAGVARRLEKIESERAGEKRAALIEAHASALVDHGHYLSRPRIVKLLNECKTEEGIVLKAKNLAIAARDDIESEYEQVAGPQTVEAALARKWDEEKLSEQYPGADKDEWVKKNAPLFTLADFKETASV
jgi:hypothetical protein